MLFGKFDLQLMQQIIRYCPPLVTTEKVIRYCPPLVTTDGAPSMTGKEAGLVSLLRKKAADNSNSDLIHYHCVIHQEALVTRVSS